MNFKILLLTTFLTFAVITSGQKYNETDLSYAPLVRRKRYLTFPAGSSLQLVYCLTMPLIGQFGAFITMGSTIALAWELPSTPEEILELKGKRFTTTTTEAPTTTLPPLHHDVEDDHNHNSYYDYGDTSYKRIDSLINSLRYTPVKSYYNPYWKNHYGHSPSKIIKNYKKYDSRKTSYVHPVYYGVHRRTRRDLYEKFEKLFNAMNRDGRACLLKAICEVNQTSDKKGTLLQEILKAIFRIKPHEDYPDEDHYDSAANKSHNCEEEYPSCEHSVWTDMLF